MVANWLILCREKSGLKPEPDEDNYEKADAEIMKAREWDEFKEANPRYVFILFPQVRYAKVVFRGSGNTLNRG